MSRQLLLQGKDRETFAEFYQYRSHPQIAWANLKSLAEGTALAS